MHQEPTDVIAKLNDWGDRCFVRGPFRFVLALELTDAGLCWVIWYQNGSSEPCRICLMLDVPGTPLNLSYNLTCEPRESGVCSVPWAVPNGFEGRRQDFHVYANVIGDAVRDTSTHWKNGIQVQEMPTLSQGLLRYVALPLFTRTIFIRGEGVVVVDIPIGISDSQLSSEEDADLMHAGLRYGFLLLFGTLVLGVAYFFIRESLN